MQFNYTKPLVLFFTLSTLSACTSIYKPQPTQLPLKSNSSIAVTAGVSQTFVRSADAKMILCTQSMADAAFDQGEGGDVSYALVDASEDQISGESNENEVEMAGRTPAVLMARELMFRACEFSSNYGLNKKEAINIYQQTLQTIGNVWATEAGNTTVSIGDTIGSTSSLSQNNSNTNPQTSPSSITPTTKSSDSDNNDDDD